MKSRATAVFALSFTGAVLYAGPTKAPSANSTMTAAALKFQAPDPGDCPVNSSRQEMGPCEKRMLEMMNAARSDPVNDAETGGRARPLKWDPRLAKAALAHSQDMAARRYFDHIDVSGQSPVERIYQAGVQWLSLGENIAKGPSVASAEKNFMSEPRFQLNHRANILSPKFNCAGIGIARGPDGLLYITQDFAQEP